MREHSFHCFTPAQKSKQKEPQSYANSCLRFSKSYPESVSKNLIVYVFVVALGVQDGHPNYVKLIQNEVLGEL